MIAPGWVRRRRRLEHAKTAMISAELQIQAIERSATSGEAEPAEGWTPRGGMSFASEG